MYYHSSSSLISKCDHIPGQHHLLDGWLQVQVQVCSVYVCMCVCTCVSMDECDMCVSACSVCVWVGGC